MKKLRVLESVQVKIISKYRDVDRDTLESVPMCFEWLSEGSLAVVDGHAIAIRLDWVKPKERGKKSAPVPLLFLGNIMPGGM